MATHLPVSCECQILSPKKNFSIILPKASVQKSRWLKKTFYSQPAENGWGSPGLVVMGGDSCSRGRGFESRYRILDGHYFTFICSKNCVFGKTKINAKRGRVGPFLKKAEFKVQYQQCKLLYLHKTLARWEFWVIEVWAELPLAVLADQFLRSES